MLILKIFDKTLGKWENWEIEKKKKKIEKKLRKVKKKKRKKEKKGLMCKTLWGKSQKK